MVSVLGVTFLFTSYGASNLLNKLHFGGLDAHGVGGGG